MAMTPRQAGRPGRLVPAAVAVALLVIVAACDLSANRGSASAGPTVVPASGASSGGPSLSASPAGSASQSLPPGTFVNPVIDDDFPDPFVFRADDHFYAYATTDGAQNLQLARSDDLVSWEILSDPLPKIAGWSSGDTWAPEVLKTSAGYVLYYTAHDSALKRPDANGSQCVTLAVAATPEGPFVDSTTEPLVCQRTLGGSIDATAFVDTDGKAYLVWKNDGNCCGLRTRFFIQRLSADGLHLTGRPTDLGIVNDEPWEGPLIEAPTLIEQDGTYFLFYSANGYDTEFYAVGYATATKVTGPYKDAADNPILASAWGRPVTSQARGPGHQSIVQGPHGDLWMAYHAWDDDAVGYGNYGQRSVWIDRLTIDGGKASVAGPTDTAQPVP